MWQWICSATPLNRPQQRSTWVLGPPLWIMRTEWHRPVILARRVCAAVHCVHRRVSSIGTLNVGAFVGCSTSWTREACATAFSKMKGNLIKRALLPLFCFFQPKRSAFWLQQGALSANHFLITDFNKFIHSLHSPRVKPIHLAIMTDLRRNVLSNWTEKRERFVAPIRALQRTILLVTACTIHKGRLPSYNGAQTPK